MGHISAIPSRPTGQPIRVAQAETGVSEKAVLEKLDEAMKRGLAAEEKTYAYETVELAVLNEAIGHYEAVIGIFEDTQNSFLRRQPQHIGKYLTALNNGSLLLRRRAVFEIDTGQENVGVRDIKRAITMIETATRALEEIPQNAQARQKRVDDFAVQAANAYMMLGSCLGDTQPAEARTHLVKAIGLYQRTGVLESSLHHSAINYANCFYLKYRLTQNPADLTEANRIMTRAIENAFRGTDFTANRRLPAARAEFVSVARHMNQVLMTHWELQAGTPLDIAQTLIGSTYLMAILAAENREPYALSPAHKERVSRAVMTVLDQWDQKFPDKVKEAFENIAPALRVQLKQELDLFRVPRQ